MRWSLESVSKVLGHTDVRTTQIYAHLAPSALQADAMRAQAAYSLHGASTAQRPAARSPGNSGHARQDSNLRHSASKASEKLLKRVEIAPRGGAVEAIVHVLRLAAAGELAVTGDVIHGLDLALAYALDREGGEQIAGRSA
jgi:hypothetical protein